ncbi:MAG: zinc ribbon domain-containing protein [Desulfobacterota bacterium]|nr:zinc ribbon domain-containing protein [Thermodesulfobacteriota bacterium]
MFFFIAGIQPKTVELEPSSRACPRCGLNQVRLKRVDHYVSLFFIPLIPVKRGTPFLECRSCGGLFSETGQPWAEGSQENRQTCPACGQPMDASFRYCPSCGRPVH